MKIHPISCFSLDSYGAWYRWMLCNLWYLLSALGFSGAYIKPQDLLSFLRDLDHVSNQEVTLQLQTVTHLLSRTWFTPQAEEIEAQLLHIRQDEIYTSITWKVNSAGKPAAFLLESKPEHSILLVKTMPSICKRDFVAKWDVQSTEEQIQLFLASHWPDY